VRAGWLGETDLDQIHEVSGLVGRKSESAELCIALEDAANGRGRLLLISGEPGIGKTRLADEFSSLASARHAQVLWGRCWEGAGAPAYWPWIQAIKSMARSHSLDAVLSALAGGTYGFNRSSEDNREVVSGGETRHLRSVRTSRVSTAETVERMTALGGDPEQRRFRLFSLVAESFREASRTVPLALVLDDLHDADQSSLLMLQSIARALRDACVTIVGTFREVEVERSKTLSTLVARIAREATHLPLRGLAEPDIADFVTIRLGTKPAARLVTMLHDGTGGNPLFLDGVMRMLTAQSKLGNTDELAASDLSLPAGVRIAIRKQINSLSEPVQELLSIASVLGNEFGLDALERVAAPGDAVLEHLGEAVAAGILIPVRRSLELYRFAHALIRSTIYDALAAAERVRLHGEIATSLEDLYASNPAVHVAELAHHYVEAVPSGTADKAIAYSIKAGNAAYSVFSYEEAAIHWRSALSLMEKQGVAPGPRATLLSRLGEKMLSNGKETSEYMEQAIALYEAAGQPQKAAFVRVRLAAYLTSPLSEATDVARAIVHLQAAEPFMLHSSKRGMQEMFHISFGSACMVGMRNDEGLAASDRQLELLRANGDAPNGANWIHPLEQRGVFLIATGRPAEGFDQIEQAWKIADEFTVNESPSEVAFVGGAMCRFLLDPVGAQRWLERELNMPRTSNSRSRREVLQHEMRLSLVLAGELKKARELFSARWSSRYMLTLLGLMEGNWHDLEESFKTHLDWSRRTGHRVVTCDFIPEVARFLFARREYAQAEALHREALAMSLEGHDLRFEMRSRTALSLLHVVQEQAERARPHIARIREIMAGGEDWRGLAGYAACSEAAVAAAAGRFDEARPQFARGIEIFRRYQVPWEEAEALSYWGRALVAEGEKELAVEKFKSAIDIYRNHGAGQQWIDRVMADMPARGPQYLSPPESGIKDVTSTFRREGDYWTLCFGNEIAHLRDSKGMRYIAHLLRRPGEQVSSIELVSLTGAGDAESGTGASVTSASEHLVSDLGDAGEMLDREAIAQYKRRRDELRAEIDRASRDNDVGAEQRARAESEALSRELSSAMGVGGQLRKAASHRERARVRTNKRIQAALENIRTADPSLGLHLASSIRTGHSCCYAPIQPIRWLL
jgi:tetratricopeptide (TPR) repeat protein